MTIQDLFAKIRKFWVSKVVLTLDLEDELVSRRRSYQFIWRKITLFKNQKWRKWKSLAIYVQNKHHSREEERRGKDKERVILLSPKLRIQSREQLENKMLLLKKQKLKIF